MKIDSILKVLPKLSSRDRDIETWYDNFQRIMELSGIEDKKKIFIWAKESMQGMLKGVVEDQKVRNEDGTYNYPTLEEIKAALEEHLDITPQEKCSIVKSLVIQRGETIKDFNWRYKRLFKSLPMVWKEFITVKDYLRSIAQRPYARSEVIMYKCETLEEAFEAAELAESVEEPIMDTNKVRTRTEPARVHALYPFQNTSTSSNYPDYNNSTMPTFVPRHRNNNNNFNTNPYRRNQNNVSFGYTENQFKCYKCNQPGHKVFNCPYTYQQLADMERNNQGAANRMQTTSTVQPSDQHLN